MTAIVYYVDSVLLRNISSCMVGNGVQSPSSKHCFGDSHVTRSIYLNPALSTSVKGRCYDAMPLASSPGRKALSVITPRFCPDGRTTGNKGLLGHLHSEQVSMLRLGVLLEASFLRRKSPKEELTFTVPGHVKHGQGAECRLPDLRVGTAKGRRGKKFDW